MKRLIIGLVVAITVALGLTAATTAVPTASDNPVVKAVAPQSASASECDNGTRQNLKHDYDEGYDAAIQFQGVKLTSGGGCVWGTGYLFEGYDAYGAGWRSAEKVYVNAGAKIVCKDPVLLAYGVTQWQVQWDSTGWHDIGTYPFYSSYTCVYQLD